MPTAVRRRGVRHPASLASRRDDASGDTLGLLVLWPALITSMLLLLVQAFIVTNAQSEAEVAASLGLRAAWRTAASEDFFVERGPNGIYTERLYVGQEPHPAVLEMAEAVKDAVAEAASTTDGWRWWGSGAGQVYSNWCAPGYPGRRDNPADRPELGETGWVRVVVTGEVFGPLAALWPNRLDRVYAHAEGPAVLGTAVLLNADGSNETPPLELPLC